MKFYDLQAFSNYSIGENPILEVSKMAERLGFEGIAIADVFENLEKLKEQKAAIELARKEVNIDIVSGVTIKTRDKLEMKRLLGQVRDKVEIVIVDGGSYRVNRAACEDSRVDILARPEFERTDNGLDEVCLKAARENNVAIQINFREILHTYRRIRNHMLTHIGTNMRLADEMRVKLIVCSGAQSKWDIRDPRELVSLANVLGMELNKAFSIVSDIPQSIVETNRKKLEGGTIMDGVEVVE